MQLRFLNRFKRITYSTSYLPEIDGLRFLAIFSVVVIMHITHYIDEKFHHSGLIQNDYWKNFVIEGGHGVALFFVISGFILSLPFAKWRLNKEKKVSLKKYFLRRVTRLEPPYLIALIIFFMAHVWVLQKYTFDESLPHLFASMAYLHTIIYHSFSTILPIAWSLEVEVQFYVLAPLFFLVFLIPQKPVRWAIMSVIILGGALYWYNVDHVVHVFRYIYLFFCGILLADMYCTQAVIIKNQFWGFLVGLCSLLGFIFIPALYNMPLYLTKLACMFFLVHIVLTNVYMKKVFSGRLIIVIGGMCYSIYLLHFAVISFVGRLLVRSGVPVSNTSLFLLFVLFFVVSVLAVSAIYFVLIEKPFMRPIGLGRLHPSKAIAETKM
jgi:peptidoglycan/LPS O-acetylase OafA/YrhL